MRWLLPPFLFLFLLAAIAVTSWFAHEPDARPLPAVWSLTLALPVGLVGLILLVSARIRFARADSEIMTFATPRNLVTEGPFRFTRNPMYLGFTLLLAAAALLANLWVALLAPLAFFLAAQFWYVPAEERAARRTFGPAYEEYMARTRR